MPTSNLTLWPPAAYTTYVSPQDTDVVTALGEYGPAVPIVYGTAQVQGIPIWKKLMGGQTQAQALGVINNADQDKNGNWNWSHVVPNWRTLTQWAPSQLVNVYEVEGAQQNFTLLAYRTLRINSGSVFMLNSIVNPGAGNQNGYTSNTGGGPAPAAGLIIDGDCRWTYAGPADDKNGSRTVWYHKFEDGYRSDPSAQVVFALCEAPVANSGVMRVWGTDNTVYAVNRNIPDPYDPADFPQGTNHWWDGHNVLQLGAAQEGPNHGVLHGLETVWYYNEYINAHSQVTGTNQLVNWGPLDRQSFEFIPFDNSGAGVWTFAATGSLFLNTVQSRWTNLICPGGDIPGLKFEVMHPSATLAAPDIDPAYVITDILNRQGIYNVQVDIGPDGSGSSSYRTYCAAMGFRVSRAIITRGTATPYVDDLLAATNSTMIFSEGVAKIIPLGDTATGSFIPPANSVVIDEDELIFKEGDDPVTVERMPEADVYNCIPVTYNDRDSNYDEVVTEHIDQVHANANGIIRGQKVTLGWVFSLKHAHQISQILVMRSIYQRNTYKFRIGPRWAQLEPGDYISLTESHFGLNNVQCRITSIEHAEDGTFSVKALECPLGTAHPLDITPQRPDGSRTSGNSGGPGPVLSGLSGTIFTMGDDGVLSPAEKTAASGAFYILYSNGEQTKAVSHVLWPNLSTASYQVPFNALDTYLSGITPSWWDWTTGDSLITGSVWATKWKDAYDGLNILRMDMQTQTQLTGSEALTSATIANYSATVAFASASAAFSAANNAYALADAAFSSSALSSMVYYAATGPAGPHNVDDIWFNTDTTTNCPDNNCLGHTTGALNVINVGAYPHRSKYWGHRWDGANWVYASTEQRIIASEIYAGAIQTQHISASTIQGSHIKAGTIQSTHISASTIQGTNISASTIEGTHIKASTIQVSNCFFAVASTSSVVGMINASNEGITISGNRITINGTTTFGSGYDPTGKVPAGGAASDINGNVTTIDGGKITADTIKTSDYAEDGNGFATAGCKMFNNSSGTPFKVAPAGIQIGKKTMNEAWFGTSQFASIAFQSNGNNTYTYFARSPNVGNISHNSTFLFIPISGAASAAGFTAVTVNRSAANYNLIPNANLVASGSWYVAGFLPTLNGVAVSPTASFQFDTFIHTYEGDI